MPVRTPQSVDEARAVHRHRQRRRPASGQAMVAKDGLPYPQVPHTVGTVSGVDQQKRSWFGYASNDELSTRLERPAIEQENLEKTREASTPTSPITRSRHVQRRRQAARC